MSIIFVPGIKGDLLACREEEKHQGHFEFRTILLFIPVFIILILHFIQDQSIFFFALAIIKPKALAKATVNFNSEANLTMELNNSGVSLISVGKYEEAVATLAKALNSSKKILADADDANEPLQMAWCLDQCMAQSPKINDVSYNDDSEKKVYIYQRAISIPLTPCEPAVLSSVIIIFNLALAYQLAAGDSDKRSSYLRKAAKLYELAYNLHNEENFESATFCMACINNLGLIYEELHDTITAQKCFQHVLSTLMFLVDCGETNGSQLDGFFRNTSHLICQKTTAAAA
jgi:tetratricopeptide (TPR) repeat protein